MNVKGFVKFHRLDDDELTIATDRYHFVYLNPSEITCIEDSFTLETQCVITMSDSKQWRIKGYASYEVAEIIKKRLEV